MKTGTHPFLRGIKPPAEPKETWENPTTAGDCPEGDDRWEKYVI